MTKAEQARLVTWQLRIPKWSAGERRQISSTCRHFGNSPTAFYRWKRYEKARPGHRLQTDVKFLERIPGTRRRFYQFNAIDDCTRIRILKVYDASNRRTTYER